KGAWAAGASSRSERLKKSPRARIRQPAASWMICSAACVPLEIARPPVNGRVVGLPQLRQSRVWSTYHKRHTPPPTATCKSRHKDKPTNNLDELSRNGAIGHRVCSASYARPPSPERLWTHSVRFAVRFPASESVFTPATRSTSHLNRPAPISEFG